MTRFENKSLRNIFEVALERGLSKRKEERASECMHRIGYYVNYYNLDAY